MKVNDLEQFFAFGASLALRKGMKNLKALSLKAIGLTVFGLIAINCGSNSNNNPTTTGYAMNSSGQCVSTTTGQVAPSTTYCTTSGYGQYGTGAQQVCVGTYMWNGQQGYCTASPDNCRGYTLISENPGTQGQTVTCM